MRIHRLEQNVAIQGEIENSVDQRRQVANGSRLAWRAPPKLGSAPWSLDIIISINVGALIIRKGFGNLPPIPIPTMKSPTSFYQNEQEGKG